MYIFAIHLAALNILLFIVLGFVFRNASRKIRKQREVIDLYNTGMAMLTHDVIHGRPLSPSYDALMKAYQLSGPLEGKAAEFCDDDENPFG